MKKIRIVFLLIIINTFLFALCFAKSSSTNGAAFLKQAIGTRAAGMGEAFCAVADDLSAGYYNPAGLAQMNIREAESNYESQKSIKYLDPQLVKFKNKYINTMFLKGLIDTNYGFLAYAQSLDIGGFFGHGITSAGLSFLTFQGGDIEVNLTNLDGSFKSSSNIKAEEDYLIVFTYSEYISMINPLFIKESKGRHFFGVNLKVIDSRLAEKYEANAVAVDLGWLYKSVTEKISLGINLQNLGGGIKYLEETDPLPLNVRIGIAYRFGAFKQGLSACDLVLPLKDNKITIKKNLGFEYWIKDMIAARVGYKSGYGLDSFTSGIGFKINRWQLDYAFYFREELNPGYQFSLTCIF